MGIWQHQQKKSAFSLSSFSQLDSLQKRPFAENQPKEEKPHSSQEKEKQTNLGHSLSNVAIYNTQTHSENQFPGYIQAKLTVSIPSAAQEMLPTITINPLLSEILNRAPEDQEVKNTETYLHAFGNKSVPRLPREGRDIEVVDGFVEAQAPPAPQGASTFGNINKAPLTGHYHIIPRQTQMPEGLDVIEDKPKTTHHTIFPTQRMEFKEFQQLFSNLSWEYGGKK